MDEALGILEMEDWEELEGMEEGEDWEAGRPSGGRPGTIVMPPVIVRVRPNAVLSRFGFDSARLQPAHWRQLRLIVGQIVRSWHTRRPIRTIRLVGHTDSRGSAAYNRRLGLRRAQAVRKALRRMLDRVRPGLGRRIRLIPQTLGERRPAASNRTAAGRARNRRVELFFVRSRRPARPGRATPHRGRYPMRRF